jgi:hypothetical protein
MAANISMAELIRPSRTEPAPTKGTTEPLQHPEEPADEYPCYAKLRGPRQVAFMLELRFETGDSDAFDYGLLGRVRHNLSSGLKLEFANAIVSISGKNLRELKEALLMHRVPWIGLTNDPGQVAATDPGATIVTAISIDAARSSLEA